jgi:hypothetical protein
MQGERIPIPKYRNEHNHRGQRPGLVFLEGPRPFPPWGINPARHRGGTRPRTAAVKYAGCHPKASELCSCRGKPGETLVDARHGSDVQIDRQTRA